MFETIEAVIDKKAKNFKLWSYILYPLSLLYKTALWLHHLSYFLHLRKQHSFSACIVCVGNIRVGGTGKTPFVHKLLSDLGHNKRIGVISTGYKALGVSAKSVLSCKESNGALLPACFCGDEPAMLQRQFPNIDFYICKQRKRAIETAVQQGKQILILDDGFGQQAIKKNISIIMLDPECDLKKAAFLPSGPLRDFPKRLKKADYVCLSYESTSSIDLQKAKNNIQRYTCAQVLACCKVPVKVEGEWQGPITLLDKQRLGVFCAIARPHRFTQCLESLKTEIATQWILKDHSSFNIAQLQEFSDKAKQLGAKYLICTEKDYIKAQHIPTSLPKGYLKMQTELIYGQKQYEALLQSLLT